MVLDSMCDFKVSVRMLMLINYLENWRFEIEIEVDTQMSTRQSTYVL